MSIELINLGCCETNKHGSVGRILGPRVRPMAFDRFETDLCGHGQNIWQNRQVGGTLRLFFVPIQQLQAEQPIELADGWKRSSQSCCSTYAGKEAGRVECSNTSARSRNGVTGIARMRFLTLTRLHYFNLRFLLFCIRFHYRGNHGSPELDSTSLLALSFQAGV